MTKRNPNLNSTVRTLVLAGMLGTFFSGAVPAKDIYMGEKSPYPTMTAALAAVRALPAGEAHRILVHGGAYYDTQVQLTAADSGLTIENVPGETPVFYGGDLVTGWETEGKFQVARILESSVGKGLAPRLLLVNGESRSRARFPATNTLTHETRFSVPWMSTTGGGWQRRPTIEELTTLQYRAGDLGDWLVTTNVEITVFHMWDESCLGVAGHDSARRVLTLAPAAGHPPGAFGVQKYVLWNIKEGMTEPGQWYHDRARQRLVYWPRPGEDIRRVAVVAPSRAVLFSIRGTRQQPVRGITLRGLTFSATTVPLIAGGFAAAKFDGAVSLSQVEDCLLERLTIKGVAGHGITADGARVRVENCDISDCGAGGVYAGGTKVVIRNNHISKVGRSYPSAMGIYRGGNECLVSHNEVHDCTYSAISYAGRSNIIEGNLIYDCMKVLHDGAAIYMFGAKNSVLRGNLARDFKDHGGYGASAYYLDEQCSDCVVEGNVSLRVNWPAHNHMATNNIIRDNLFVVEGDAKITFPRSTGYTFARNVLYATGKIRFEGTNAVATWSDNLLYSGKGQIECVTQNRYSAVKTVTNAPPNSVVADPEFVNFARGDFRYRPGSPALKMSLRPVDASSAGRLTK